MTSSTPSYVVEYRAKYGGLEGVWRELRDVTATHYELGGLKPFTVYQLRVSALNSIGRGLPSDIIETTTSELG